MLLYNFDMKQTIKTKNYNAVIEIPYEKMARKPNWTQIQAESEQQQCNQHTKTVIVPQCHGCCHQRSNENKVSISLLEQLEVAFERDMRQKNGEIESLRGDIVSLKSQLSQNKNEVQKMKASLSNEEIKYMRIIKQRDDEIIKIKRQVELGLIERQKMIKAKIAQYQTNYMQYQKSEQERIRKLEQQYRIKNKQQFDKLELIYRQQRQNLNNQLLQLKLTMQHKVQISQLQIQRYGKQIESYKMQVANLKIALGQKQQQNKNATDSINQKSLSIYKLQIQADGIKKQIQQLTNQNNRNLQSIKVLKQTLCTRQEELAVKQQLINNKCKQYEELNSECQDILAINKSLETKCNSLNLQLATFINNKTVYLNKIQQLELSIKSYQEQISRKEVPKVYEVKIEKVIDRQDYIIVIQAELQKYKRNNLELCDKIKQLELIIAHREKQITDCKSKILELQEQIHKLRCYIEQKQRSYAWIVQRQITRDIQINKGEINKTYKVFPSQPKVFYNFKEVRENQIPVRTFAENENLILENIQSSMIFKNEQNEELRKAIIRQLNKDISQDKVTRMEIKEVTTGARVQHFQS